MHGPSFKIRLSFIFHCTDRVNNLSWGQPRHFFVKQKSCCLNKGNIYCPSHFHCLRLQCIFCLKLIFSRKNHKLHDLHNVHGLCGLQFSTQFFDNTNAVSHRLESSPNCQQKGKRLNKQVIKWQCTETKLMTPIFWRQDVNSQQFKNVT